MPISSIDYILEVFCGSKHEHNVARLELLCLGKVQQFLLCPACHIWTVYCQQMRQKNFLAQWLTFTTKKVKLHVEFS